DQRWQSIVLTIRITIHDLDVLAFDIASFFEPTVKGCSHVRRRIGGTRLEKADHWHRRLLCGRREWPRRRAAEQRDKLAAPHSITSSARCWSCHNTSRPSALAVFRLMVSPYLVGACTGRSAGFSPLRMHQRRSLRAENYRSGQLRRIVSRAYPSVILTR